MVLGWTCAWTRAWANRTRQHMLESCAKMRPQARSSSLASSLCSPRKSTGGCERVCMCGLGRSSQSGKTEITKVSKRNLQLRVFAQSNQSPAHAFLQILMLKPHISIKKRKKERTPTLPPSLLIMLLPLVCYIHCLSPLSPTTEEGEKKTKERQQTLARIIMRTAASPCQSVWSPIAQTPCTASPLLSPPAPFSLVQNGGSGWQ